MTPSAAPGPSGPVLDSVPARVWRLQYGPCWCRSTASDTDSFDFVRMRVTPADLGRVEENMLIVSERVIEGSNRVFRRVFSDVPDPKLVISTGPCPMASRFWDELPGGWRPVSEILPIDIHVEDCISGNPESLLTAVVGHLFAREATASRVVEDQAVSLSG